MGESEVADISAGWRIGRVLTILAHPTIGYADSATILLIIMLDQLRPLQPSFCVSVTVVLSWWF